jgi:hypothetical protein
MEKSAAKEKKMCSIADPMSASYSVSERPKWIQDSLGNFVVTSNYDPLL